jgi:pyruvate/2-oxoglutarate dehydrogenase complex dihydrolipoamide acyltransferase (E2) component
MRKAPGFEVNGMRIEVRLPSLGDDADAVQGGTITMWCAVQGARMDAGDDLVELATDKAAFVVPSPVHGVLVETLVHENDEVRVGDVLCVMETDEADGPALGV